MSHGPGQSDELVAAVAAFVDRRRLLARGQAVLVGLSGGPDSVALLAVLRDLSAEGDRAYRLTAAHLDHGLRAGSAADAAFAADLARRWGIDCIVERRDVAAIARHEGLSIESAARKQRYDFLADAADRAGAAAVAVGHHADDNAETVLYRILRGTHLRGLAGIPAERTLPGGLVRLVRPMLGVRREQIEAFCRRRELTWRTDETNADTTYRRNFIRHQLLPLLRDRLNPRVDEALLRLADAAGQVEDSLADQAATLLQQALRPADPADGRIVLDARVLAAHHAVLRTYALRAALERLGAPLGKVTAEQLSALGELAGGAGPPAVNLPGPFAARREGDNVILEAGASEPAGQPWRVPLACPGETPLPDGRTIVCRVQPMDRAAFEAHCSSRPAGVEMLDADRLRGPLTCRSREEGDSFVPLGAPGRQTVSDFLTNARLPRRLRDDVLCIADEEGIAYLAPLRIADRARVTPETRRVLRIELRAGQEEDSGIDG